MSERKAIPKELRKRVLDKCAGYCAYCGTDLINNEGVAKFQVDHLVSVKRGGANDFSNLYAACGSCNNYKNTFTLEQFREELNQQVKRLERFSVNYRLATRFGLVRPTGNKVRFYFETHNR